MNNNTNAIRILGAAILLMALLVLVGWAFGIVALISLTPNMTAMNPTTAFTLSLIAIWVLVRCSKKEGQAFIGIEVILAFCAFTVGSLKLLEFAHLLGDFHIDRLLFADKLSTRLRHNEIAPTTATLFFTTSLLLFNSYKTTRLTRMVNDALLFGSFLVAYLGIIGYIYSLEPFYRIGPFVPMALTTACCFMALLIALFLLPPHGNLYKTFFSRHLGGTVVRQAMPVVLLIPPVFGYARLLLHRARFYNLEYGIALDTAFLVLIILLLIFFYANALNKKDQERKIAENVLVQSEEKYRSLVYALKEGVMYYNNESQLIFCNPSFAEMMGYSSDELIGKNIVDVLIPEEHRDRARIRMNERLSGIPRDYESQMLHKDGTSIDIYITSRRISKEGETPAFLSTVIDITQRKKKEEDVEAFSASAAHDLNAPLARIESLSSYLLEYNKDHLNEEDIEFLGMIVKTTVDMRTLLKDLLAFSKAGADKLEKVPLDMNKMVRNILTSFPHPGVTVTVEDLPVAYGDMGTIKQVWINLVLNAIKYSSKKDQPAVQVGCTRLNDKTVYYVRDNGAGFDMSESSKLFAPFKRLHSDFEGNGLGLPIVKRIVEKHGGKIWAEGEKNVGAVFYFTI